MSQCVLFRNYSDNQMLNKEIEVITYGNNNIIPCQIVEPCDSEKPILLLGLQFFDFKRINYVYLDTFDRYYFIDHHEVVNAGMVKLYLSEDYLYSWRDYILGLSCLIERQEFLYSNLMADDLIIPRIDRVTHQKNIGSVGGNATGTHIALTVTGGN